MKKQIIAAVSTHPVRAAFLFILLFLLGSVTHETLAQRNTGKGGVPTNLSQVAPPLTGAITGRHAPSQPAPNTVVPAALSSTWTVATQYPTTIVNLSQVMPSIDGTVATADASNIYGAVGTVPTLPQSQLPGAPTNSITTLFASNNFGNPGGANYFDLTVGSNSISVTSLDINTAETVAFTNVRVYVLPGMTSVGHETNMALWTQVATGSGTGAGVDLPTHVTLSNPFQLNAGTLYGIAVVADPAITLHYTNGNGSNQNYSNADLSLVLGSTSNVPFTAPVFSPRVWNGTVYYTNACTPAWQNEPPIANGRRNPATVAVGSNLYAITGFNAAPNYTAVNERFDGTSWTTQAPVPVPHAQSRGTAVGTNIYVPGGFNSVSFSGPLDTMQIYNTTANTWSAGMTLPAARSGVATAAFNNRVYVIAGYNPVSTGHNDVYIYNPATNSYTTGAPMPGNQGNAPGVLYNGEIYVVGGGTAPGAQYAYNPTTNTWRTIAVLPTSGGTCQSGSGFVQDGEMWITGCLGLPIGQQVWIYNSGTNAWRAGPTYSVDHQGPGAAFFNGRGFVVGGGAASGGSTAVESVRSCSGCPSRVLIVYADTTAPTQLQSEIFAEPGVTAVDVFNAQAGTPTLAQLQQYNIVVPYSNFPFLDGITLGNNLADYVDGGGVVVQCGFSHYGPGQPYGVNGRWLTGSYNPYNYSTNQQINAFSLGTHNAGHPLMAGVTMLNGNFANVVTLAAGATEVAQNNLGNSLIAYRPVSGGHTTVGVTAYVGSDSTQSGHWGRVIINAGRWLGGNCAPVPSSVVSRKVHGGAGTFDVNLPVTGTPGVECRTGGATNDYTVVVTFSGNITVTGSPQAEVTSGTGCVGSGGACNGGTVSISSNAVTIPLTNITNAQTIMVRLNSVNGSGNVTIPMSILVGDTNGDRFVNSGDTLQTRNRAGQTTDTTNFRSDVNTDGTINSGDTIAVRSRSGTFLP